MSIDNRSKMVSFRLTEEEYDRFRDLCYAKGIPSVSEMAREAIGLFLQQPERATPDLLENRVSELETRTRLLAVELKRLSQHSCMGALAKAAAAGNDSHSGDHNGSPVG